MVNIICIYGWAPLFYYPEVVLHGCWTKSKQNPLFNVSAVAAEPSWESVWIKILNGVLKPEKCKIIKPTIIKSTCTYLSISKFAFLMYFKLHIACAKLSAAWGKRICIRNWVMSISLRISLVIYYKMCVILQLSYIFV